MATGIGTVQEVSGQVWVTGADGIRKLLQAGDTIHQNDYIETNDQSKVTIQFENGKLFTMGALNDAIMDLSLVEGQEEGEVIVDLDLLEELLRAESDSDVRASSDVGDNELQDALLAGESLDDLEATAAGLTNLDVWQMYSQQYGNSAFTTFGDIQGLQSFQNIVNFLNSATNFDQTNLNNAEQVVNTILENLLGEATEIDFPEGITAEDLIAALNGQPLVADGQAEVLENSKFYGAVDGIDLDGDSLSYEVVDGVTIGTMSFNPASGTFVFDTGTAFDYLQLGETEDVTFTYRATDGDSYSNTATVTITVTGLNDAAIISGDTTGSVSEDTDLVVEGQLDVSDADHDQSAFTAQTIEGTYGTLVIDADGGWSYALNNDLDAVQDLGNGDTLAENFTVTSVDGTEQAIAITVNGADDAPTMTVEAGALDFDMEDTENNENISQDDEGNTYFTIDLADMFDNPESIEIDDLNIVSSDGHTENVDYTLDGTVITIPISNDDQFAYLPEGEQTTLTIEFDAHDTETGLTTEDISFDVTLTGTNDVPEAEVDTGTTDEGSEVVIDVLENDSDVDTTAVLTLQSAQIVDADGNPVTGQGSVSIVDGKLVFDPGADFDYLQEGEDETVSIQYTISDDQGATTTSTATVTVTGTNDTAVITGDSTGSATEDTGVVDGELVVEGQLTATDADHDQSAFTAATMEGAYGTLTINADGSWTYTADNESEMIQDLNPEESLDELFTVTSVDGTEQNIAISINGTYDAPELVVEDGDDGLNIDMEDPNSVYTTEDGTQVFSIDLADMFGENADNIEIENLGITTSDGHTENVDFTLDGTVLIIPVSYEDQFAYLPEDEQNTLTINFDVHDTETGITTPDYSVDVTLTGTNDAPEIESVTGHEGGIGTTGEEGEMVRAEEGDVVAQVNADDVDLGDELTYTIVNNPTVTVENEDGTTSEMPVFTINEDGEISLTAEGAASLDYEYGETYDLEVKVEDKDGESDTVDVTINVNDLYTNAEATIGDGGTGEYAGDSYVNADEVSSVAISGTIETGAALSELVMTDVEGNEIDLLAKDENGDSIYSITYTDNEDGTTTFTVSGVDVSEMADGTLTVDYTSVDAAGNEKDGSTEITKDTQTNIDSALDTESDTGSNTADALTNDTTPTISGMTEPNATVEVYETYPVPEGATPIATTTADGEGNYNVTVALAEGFYTLGIVATDAAGNESTTSTALTVDTTADYISTSLAEDSGTSTADGLTNNGTINVDGLESGSSYVYSTDGGESWTTGSGSSFTVSEGTYEADQVQIKTTDAAGNESDPVKLGEFEVDVTADAATVSLAEDSGTSTADGLTNNGTINVDGLESGSNYVYSTDGGESWTAGSGSSFSVSEGTYEADQVQIKTTDAAGNESDPVKLGAFEVDVSVMAPTITIAGDANEDGVYNQAEVEAGITATITLPSDFNAENDTLYVNGDAYSLSAEEIEAGAVEVSVDPEQSISASITDGAGNTSSVANAQAAAADVDASAPPVITNVIDHVGDYSFADMTLYGTGEPGETITLYSREGETSNGNHTNSVQPDNYVAVATTTVDAQGNWSVELENLPSTVLNDNEFFQATQTDAAGNMSALSNTAHFWHGSWSNASTEVEDDYIMMGGGNDKVTVNDNDANDKLVIDGGLGNDTAVFNFDYADSSISQNDSGEIVITEANGDVNILRNFETFQFNDGTFTAESLFQHYEITDLPDQGSIYVGDQLLAVGSIIADPSEIRFEWNDEPETILIGSKDDSASNWGSVATDGSMTIDNGDYSVSITGYTDFTDINNPGTQATLVVDDDNINNHEGVGLGVAGTGDNDQIDLGEAVVIDLNGKEVNGAEIGLAGLGGNFDSTNSADATANWIAYKDGVQVADGELRRDFSDTDGDGNLNTNVLNIDVAFDQLVFLVDANHNSNFTIQYMDFEYAPVDSYSYATFDPDGMVAGTEQTVTFSDYKPEAEDVTATVGQEISLADYISDVEDDASDSDSLVTSVRIDTLPAHGTLYLVDGDTRTEVTEGQLIDNADMAKLVVVSDPLFTGSEETALMGAKDTSITNWETNENGVINFESGDFSATITGYKNFESLDNPGTQATLTVDDDNINNHEGVGLGVTGIGDNDQIDLGEAVVINFGQTVNGAEIGLAGLGGNFQESNSANATAEWVAYDADGNEVASGSVRQDTDGTAETNTISIDVAFETLVFDVSANHNSNYTIQYIEANYTSSGDSFEYTAIDSDGHESSATVSFELPTFQPQAGLVGEFYNHEGQLSNVAQVESFIGGNAADATFTATTLSYGSSSHRGDLGRPGHLASFLGAEDASSIQWADGEGNTNDAAIHLSGYVYLETGTYDFKAYADDGFSIRLGDETVLEYDENTSPKNYDAQNDTVYGNEGGVEITEAGYYPVEMIYWDQGGQYVFQPEISKDGGDFMSFGDMTMYQNAESVIAVAGQDAIIEDVSLVGPPPFENDGTGLVAEFYQSANNTLNDIEDARSLVDSTDPTATFVAQNINYGEASMNGDLGKDYNLQEFLGDDYASLDVDPGNSSEAAIHMHGLMYLEAGTYSLKVYADDGYQINIGGETAIEVDKNQSPATKTESGFEIPMDGYYPVDIIYWDQGGQYVFQPELAKMDDNGNYGEYAPITNANTVQSEEYATQDAAIYDSIGDAEFEALGIDFYANDIEDYNRTPDDTRVTFDENDKVEAGQDGSVQVTYEDGTATLELNGAWNSVKNARAEADGPVSITMKNFVYTEVEVSGGDNTISIVDGKRGVITTGDGNDTITVDALTNDGGWDNTFYVNVGSGDNTITLSGDKGETVFDVTTGAGDDTVSLSGDYQSATLNLGDGNNTVAFAGDQNDFTITQDGDQVMVSMGDQTVTMSGADTLSFSDGSVDLSTYFDQTMELDQDETLLHTVSVGSENAGKEVTLTVSISTHGTRDTSGSLEDVFTILANGDKVVEDSEISGAQDRTYTIKAIADDSGEVDLTFINDSTGADETVTVNAVTVDAVTDVVLDNEPTTYDRDTVSAHLDLERHADVDGTDGDDVVNVIHSVNSNGTIDTHGGNDTINIGQNVDGTIDAGAGDDTISIGQHINNGASVDGGEGNDTLILSSSELLDFDHLKERIENIETLKLSDDPNLTFGGNSESDFDPNGANEFTITASDVLDINSGGHLEIDFGNNNSVSVDVNDDNTLTVTKTEGDTSTTLSTGGDIQSVDFEINNDNTVDIIVNSQH